MMRWMGLGLIAMLMLGCAGEPRSSSDPVPSTPPADPGATGPFEEWVAVYEVGEVDALQPLTQELMEKAPQNVATSPLACWPGIEEDLDGATGPYAAALAAPSREELDAAVSKLSREPILVGSYTTDCGD